MDASKIYFHLFALVSLAGMSLWILKDLWVVILVVAAIGTLFALVFGRKKR